MIEHSIFVAGRPRTKGSLKPVHVKLGRGRCQVSLREDSAESTAWLRTMVAGIREQCGITVTRVGDGWQRTDGGQPWTGAVNVTAAFLFEREPSWPSHQTEYPTSRDIGDVDKLLRNLNDALTYSRLIEDDSLITGCTGRKYWVDDWSGEPAVAGVQARVTLWEAGA